MAANLDEVVSQAIQKGYPPSLQVRVSQNFKTIIQKTWGPSYPIYDIGSMTKILCTTLLVMKLSEDKCLSLSDPVKKHLGFLSKAPAGSVRIKDLLRHHSGLFWWRPFYKKLLKLPMEQRDSELKSLFQKERLYKKRKCVYSDLDFILLGWILEEIYQAPLDVIFENEICQPLGLKKTNFIRSPFSKKKIYAPTEKRSGRIIQGEVFDDNTSSLGGVAGHAGLFSTLQETHKMGEELLRMYRGKNSLVKNSTFKKFVKRAVPKSQGDWGLGFVIPSKNGTGGKLISTNAFGHTGFTGTSLWVDPKRNAVVTILSNRTFPSRKDERFKQLRKDMHDAIWRQLDG